MAWGLPTPVAAAKVNTSTTTTTTTTTTVVNGAVTTSSTTSTFTDNADAIDIFENIVPVERVQIEGVALLQILKHCHESAPTSVAGSLLGLENDDKRVLEVTNSFPSPPRSEKKRDADEYQIEMMKNLREVGMDNNKVGWYQSVLMGTFCTASVVEYQFQYQQSLGPNAICLVYDAAETAKGALSIKAFRLKKTFVDAYKAGVFTKESFAKEDIRSTTIFDELPINVHNSDVINCWLQELVASNESVSANSFERLDLATNAYLENSLKNISVWADELAQEHYKFQGYERALQKQRVAYQQWQNRQREENKLRRENDNDDLVPEEDPNFFKSVHQPSRLESLLITKQMNTYCEHINRYAGKSFQKLFLAQKFHKDQ
uniref:Eukaryotic translation initiation factor 3 subunit H n=1 Tax=Globisporangium ultimum (strain ATCC 200006 / CBS 805.95 / DAOM BR144) TaxID=431595 RepID=K3WRY4_GLOUD